MTKPDPNVQPIPIGSAVLLSIMDDSVAVINEVIDGAILYDPPQGLAGLVEANVEHLELMTGARVTQLGDSPDLSTYEAAITAGKAYLE